MKSIPIDLTDDGCIALRRALKKAVAPFGWKVITFEKYDINNFDKGLMCVFKIPPLDYSNFTEPNFDQEKKLHKGVEPLLGYTVTIKPALGGKVRFDGRWNNVRPGIFHMNCKYICPDTRLLLSRELSPTEPEARIIEMLHNVPTSFYLVFNKPNPEYIREGRDPEKKGLYTPCPSCIVRTHDPCFVQLTRKKIIKGMAKKYKKMIGVEP